jgi:hypothetical protein
LIVLTLLGHDLLMAAFTGAASEGRETHAHAAAGRDGSLLDSVPNHQPLPAHPVDCDTTGEAIAAVVFQLDLADLPIPSALADSDFLRATLRVSAGWLEPSWPPGTRRAFLQVYRI